MQLSNTNFSDAYLSDKLYNHPPENNGIQTTASDFAPSDVLTAEMRRDSKQFLTCNNTGNIDNYHKFKYMKRYPSSGSTIDNIYNGLSNSPTSIGDIPLATDSSGAPINMGGPLHANYLPIYSYFTSFEETDPGLVDTTVGSAVTPVPLSSSVPSLSPSMGDSLPFAVGIVGMTPGLSGALSQSSTTSDNIPNTIKTGINNIVNQITNDISNIVSSISSNTSTTTTTSTTSTTDSSGTDSTGTGTDTPATTPDSTSLVWIIILIIVVAVAISVLVYFGYKRYKKHSYVDYARY